MANSGPRPLLEFLSVALTGKGRTMFFRTSDLQVKKDYAGFKKCFVTRVSTRDLAPFATAFPLEAHGEAEVIVVCGKWKKPNEDWLESYGGEMKHLRELVSYGFMDYLDSIQRGWKRLPFLDRIPQDAAGFAACPGFESWTNDRVQDALKSSGGIQQFLMPKRFVYNQAEGAQRFDFLCPLDTQLPDRLLSIDCVNEADRAATFVSPRPPGPGVLTPQELQPTPDGSTSDNTPGLWWVKPGRLAGMPVPFDAELPQIAATGIQAVVTLGVQADPAAYEAAGLRYLALDQPDEWEPDEQQLQSFTAFYKDTNGGLAVCSNNNIATGNALGVALISEGVGVSESLELIESAHPTALETMGQIEYLYMAADMLGFDLDLD